MKPSSPNVVFVLTDDQGYGDLGCTGNPHLRTPNIDAFYHDSLRLTNFHVGPTCAPTRSGLLTGHYANSTGVWHTIGGRSLLREDEWTLAGALAEGGYRTAIFGKWHLGDTYPFRPHDRGFQTSVVHGGGGITQTPDYWGNDYFDDTYFVNGEPRKYEGYCTDVWFDLARRFIADNRERPFFCYISTNAPHSPYNVAGRYADLYRDTVPEARARFYGMITNIDENFGALRRHLQELGIEDDTIVVFMTDNGSSGGARTDAEHHVVDGYNAGLRGLKGSPYDGGHRVPFFIRYPRRGIRRGVDVDRIAANVDFMPTILDLCGISQAPEREFDGMSLTPLFRAATRGSTANWPDRVLVTDSQRVAYPVKWRLSAVMSDRWRLINGEELYDMDTDLAQTRDVRHEHPSVVEQLRRAYETWWAKVSRQFDRTIPHAIGSQQWSASTLSCHDLRNDACDVAWHQGQIRSGKRIRGYWELRVDRPGSYRFELRRWPRELGYSMSAGISQPDIEWREGDVDDRFRSCYEGGVALPITWARIRVGETTAEKQVDSDEDSAVFVLDLPSGEASLEATFGLGSDEIAAYYVYVTRCDSGRF